MADSTGKCLDRLEALQSYKNALSIVREEMQALHQPPEGSKETGKQVPGTEDTPPALKDMLEYWNIPTGVSSIEPGLMSKKLKLQKEVDRSIRNLDDVFLSYLKTLPLDVTQLLQHEQGTGDLDTFDQEIQKLKKALDQVDVACLEGKNDYRARFLEKWAAE